MKPPSVPDLLSLLPQDAVEDLGHRLDAVMPDATDLDKAQMLFSFMDDCLTAEEEFAAVPEKFTLSLDEAQQPNPSDE